MTIDTGPKVYLPPIPSELPERVWMIPYRRNPFFTGRQGLLEELHECFTKNRATVLMQGQAINGLGGIGKTQIAMEYAYRHRDEYRFVLWASAASQETLRSAYVTMADRLQLPERSEREQDKIVAAVRHWLATNEEWLLIVDNADEVNMIWPMLPTGNTGHLLLTTRDQVVRSMQPFEVKPMDRAEGTRLLLRRARVLKSEMSLEQVALEDRLVAEQIVTEMDGLPLALDQAGAYVEEVAYSLQDYLTAYRQRRSMLLADRGRFTSEYSASVATTWALSFARVEQRNPAAADLLRVCAYLSPDAIPEELITKKARYLGPYLQPIETEPSLLQEMIRTLRAYSLIRRDVREKALSVHRLVQAVLQDAMGELERRTWAERTMLAVNAAFPHVEHATWQQCKRLLPHVLLVAQYIERYQFVGEETGRLLHETASYFYDRGHYAEGELLYQRTLGIREQQLGPEHPDVADSLYGLALLYRRWGKYDEAESLFLRALHIQEQQLGPEHPEVASSLHGLAFIYKQQNKYVEAEPLFLRALHIREQQLGPDHPQVAFSLNGLACLYHDQNKIAKAESLHLRALCIREQRLGPEHPEVAYSLNNLANLYFEQGKYAEAELLLLRALHIQEQQLGPDHPRVAYPLNGLASLYREQGKYTEAEPLYLRALHIREQKLGPEHPQVAYSLNNLANLYFEQGKYTEAESHYLQALHIREQQVASHPNDAGAYFSRGYMHLHLKKREDAHADFAKYESLRPGNVNAAWMVVYETFGKEHPGVEIAERLEVIAALDPQCDEAFVCRGVALGLRGKPQEGLIELEHAYNEDAWFWKGMMYAYLSQNTVAMKAIERALQADLPPILLTPLFWLERENPHFYREYAEPLLKQYELL